MIVDEIEHDPSNPHSASEWVEYTAKFENYSQLMFYREGEATFDLNYIIYRCMIKLKKELVWDPFAQRHREIDVLMVFHKFDT